MEPFISSDHVADFVTRGTKLATDVLKHSRNPPKDKIANSKQTRMLKRAAIGVYRDGKKIANSAVEAHQKLQAANAQAEPEAVAQTVPSHTTRPAPADQQVARAAQRTPAAPSSVASTQSGRPPLATDFWPGQLSVMVEKLIRNPETNKHGRPVREPWGGCGIVISTAVLSQRDIDKRNFDPRREPQSVVLRGSKADCDIGKLLEAARTAENFTVWMDMGGRKKGGAKLTAWYPVTVPASQLMALEKADEAAREQFAKNLIRSTKQGAMEEFSA
jgi:hypothetical protein